MSSSSHPGAAQPKRTRLNLPLSQETLAQLRFLAYIRDQERSAVIAALIAEAAAQAAHASALADVRADCIRDKG